VVTGETPVSPSTRAFLQTRGTARAGDYTFLGHAPEEPWWRAYRDATAFDHPTVLVTSDGARWAVYLSGIPSARLDAVGTVVRYTLVLDGPCGAEEAEHVRAGVAAWLDDVAADPAHPGGRLSAALDACFPADLVDRLVTRPFPGADPVLRYCTDATLVRSFVVQALASLPVPPAGADEPGDWFGGVAAPACRTAFVARVGLLLHGTPGRALLLNLIGGPDDAADLVDDTRPLAVLAETADRTPPRPTALRPVVEAKKAPAAAVTTAAVVGTAISVPLVVAALMLVALVVTVLMLTL
jgi:hypothetical protein